MIGRRTLLAAAALLPPVIARADDALFERGWYRRGQVKERPVDFEGRGGVKLSGTLALPLDSELRYVPGVVLIAGSGPTDRDGNNPLAPPSVVGGRIDLLREIAALLARNGIASLRYDKRGIGRSTPRPRGSLAEQEAFFAWDNFAGDVEAAHATLLRQGEVKPYATALLGHSEGGLLALAAARALGRKLHALVLTATPGRRLDVILRAQVGRDAPALLPALDHVIAQVQKTGHVPEDLSPELALLFPPYAGPFLQSLMAFEPALVLSHLANPCLLLQGGADRQVVPMEDVQPLIDALAARASAPGEALVVPQVSHNLKLLSGPTDPGFAGPLAPPVADALVKWLAPALGA